MQKVISISHAIFGIADLIMIYVCMFLVWLSTCGVDGVDMNCPTVPPTGSGIQVQLPPSLYKASHVSSVNFRLQLMVNSTALEKTHNSAKQCTTHLDVHHKFSTSRYKLEPEVSDFDFYNCNLSLRLFQKIVKEFFYLSCCPVKFGIIVWRTLSWVKIFIFIKLFWVCGWLDVSSIKCITNPLILTCNWQNNRLLITLLGGNTLFNCPFNAVLN